MNIEEPPKLTTFQKWRALIFTSTSISFGLFYYQCFAALRSEYRSQYYDTIYNFEEFYADIYSGALLLTGSSILFIGMLSDYLGPEILLFLQQFMKLVFLFLEIMSFRFNNNQFLLFVSKVGFSYMSQLSGILVMTHISKIFQRNESGFANSIQSMICIMGTGFSMYYAPVIYKIYNLLDIVFIGCVLNLVSLLLLTYNYKANYDFEKKQREFAQRHEQTEIYGQHQNKLDVLGSLKYMKNFSCPLWTIIVTFSTLTVAYQMIDIFGNTFVQRNWQMSPTKASQIESLFPIMSILFPVIGKLVDHFNKNVNAIMLIALFFCTLSEIFLVWINPYMGFIIFGICNAARMTSMVPLLQYAVDKSKIGFATSIVKGGSYMASVLMGILAGKLVDTFQGDYSFVYWITCCLSLSGMVLIVFQLVIQKKVDIPKIENDMDFKA